MPAASLSLQRCIHVSFELNIKCFKQNTSNFAKNFLALAKNFLALQKTRQTGPRVNRTDTRDNGLRPGASAPVLCLLGMCVIPRSGRRAKTNLFAITYRLRHQLSDRIEHDFKLLIVLTFEVVQPASKFGVRSE